PFAKERYWLETPVNKPAATVLQPKLAIPAAAVLHPLLHTNTSDLAEQRYSSIFTGEEFFLADHQVAVNGHGSQKVLPGVAYLEMARAAIEQAAPSQPKSSILELRSIAWLNPVIVSELRQVSIAVFADDDDQFGYEISSIAEDQKIVHCQGQAGFVRE